jgi:hypothetical protein
VLAGTARATGLTRAGLHPEAQTAMLNVVDLTVPSPPPQGQKPVDPSSIFLRVTGVIARVTNGPLRVIQPRPPPARPPARSLFGPSSACTRCSVVYGTSFGLPCVLLPYWNASCYATSRCAAL